MKKILLLATAIILSFNILAQSDGFFNDWKNIEDRDEILPEFPDYHGDLYNSDAPIGSGVLILATIGIGYAALKRKDGESS